MSAASQTIRGHKLRVGQRARPAVDTGTSGAFVGRQRELLQLRAERHRSDKGELRVAVVLGAAGLGKTRLASELLAGDPVSAVALQGRASRLTPAPPLARWAKTLGQPDSTERILDVIGAVSADRSVVVVLDDAHWTGDTFWGLVQALSQEYARSRLLVVTTARPDQLDGNRAAAEVLSALEQDDVLCRIRLEPLRRDDVAELASDRLGAAPPALSDWLMVRSRGIPRFVAGLLDGLVRARADPHVPALGGVPEELARWVHAELAQFEAGPRTLLELLAVIGSPVDPGDLADIAGETVEDVALVLETLVRSGVVVEQDHAGPLGYEIAHPVVREVLYDSLGGARRRILHQRAAGTLVNSGRAEAGTLHLLRSARVEDGNALDALIAQAREAEHQGSEALLWAIVPTLVDILPTGDTRWLALLDALSWPRRSTVSYRTAPDTQTRVGAVQRMLDQLEGVGDVRRHATILARSTDLATRTGAVDPSELCREGAGTCAEAGGDHEARLAGIELANARGWSGDLPGQETDARRLLRGAEEAGDQSAAVGALGALGLALTLQGSFAEAEEVLVRGVELAAPEDRPLVEAHTNALLASQDAMRGDMSSARGRWSEAAESGAGRHALVWESGAYIAWLSGDLATVTSRARRAEQVLPRHLSPPWIALYAAMADAEQGRVAQGRSALDRIVREYEGDDLDLFSQFRRWGEGLVAWSENRLTTAAAVLQRAVDRCAAMGAFAVLGPMLVDLAEVAAVAGDPRMAARAASNAEDLARRVGAPSVQAFHQFASAWSLLALGRPDDAATAARHAIASMRTIGFPILEARARVAYASAIRGDRARAVEALVEAIAAFESNGAVLRAGRARARMSELRSNPDRVRDMLGEPSLTERERQIAELAALGLTARQIGDRLHIGVRTVETHLARVYRKLGVGSKQQLVSRRLELGLTTP